MRQMKQSRNPGRLRPVSTGDKGMSWVDAGQTGRWETSAPTPVPHPFLGSRSALMAHREAAEGNLLATAAPCYK